ncbi:uncharacterized protein FPRO_12502 [Fusarium proliferatum ET1]|uniref:Uncharacterized protein n=1 Tax=Fusarium proliferatum (strain ET1) TaxID=1227346 RepID=A0A1L7W922_FUSPR|nr:uncharacterized protein FPRO_12502 [Fusarium proliferatum ET1]CZR49066.1 uncharacterized protein FPRO_12502 [Fusarium proliferatum ET1]
MDESTEKQAADFLARREVRGDEESQDPDQRKPQSRTGLQPTTATGNADLAEHLSAEPKSEAIPKLKLTSGNLAMLNQQSSTNASKKSKSVCSDAASHGAASVLSREAQVFLPPPPDPIVQQDDWALKKYPSLARVSKKGCSADIAFAALRAMGDCD